MEECVVKGRARGSRDVVSILAQTVCEHDVPHLAFNMAITMCGIFLTVSECQKRLYVSVGLGIKRVADVYTGHPP